MVDMQATRIQGIGEYYFSQKLREIAQLNADGHQVLNLGIGSPDLQPPAEVISALKEGVEETDFHQYQSYKGLPELRQSFVQWYQTYFDVTLNPETEVLPLIGSKEGIMHIAMAFINPGDEVLIPDPGYPTYAAASRVAGAALKGYALTAENGFMPDFDTLGSQDLTRVKLMWVNYPHMPTGADGSAELFDRLVAFSRKHQILVVNDNPYGFILTASQNSLLKNRQPDDLVLELNSLSKSHNMAGWRAGFLAGNEQLIQSVLTFKSNMDSGQFKPVMRAATAALKVNGGWYEQLNAVYRERRKKVYKIAEQLHCTYDSEQVGMFVWAKIPSSYASGTEFSEYLLNRYRIFVPPGSVFGSQGTHYIRFSLCSDLAVWDEVMNRINEVK